MSFIHFIFGCLTILCLGFDNCRGRLTKNVIYLLDVDLSNHARSCSSCQFHTDATFGYTGWQYECLEVNIENKVKYINLQEPVRSGFRSLVKI